MQITVIGAGYVGLVTGVSVARLGGHDVTFVERDSTRLAALRAGRMPIEEPGLAAAFAEQAQRITVVGDLAEADSSGLVVVAVATPIGEDGESDLAQINGVVDQLRAMPHAHLSIRSTLPPGTSQRLPALLGRTDGSRLSTNPEFLRQGSALADYAKPSRIVIGRYPETSPEHLAVIAALFAGIEAPRLEVDVAAAELIKNVANGFLALKLSFVNEVAGLCDEYGVDVSEVLDGIGLDPRIGSSYMRPGLGFGGSCLPKELQVVASAGRRKGLPMHVARAASVVNSEQQDRFVLRVLRELGEPRARIGVLGLSFKPDTDDLRGSPAVTLVRRFLEAGHQVVAFDPAVRAERAEEVMPGLIVARAAEAVFESADVVVVATEWPHFAALDFESLRSRMRRSLIYDGRNLLDPDGMAAAGYAYRAVGRPSREPAAAAARS